MKLLVTGGARFIGSHLAAGLCRLGRVRVLANFSTGSRENLADINPEPIDSAIVDRDTVRRMEGIDPWPSRRGNGDRAGVRRAAACVRRRQCHRAAAQACGTQLLRRWQ